MFRTTALSLVCFLVSCGSPKKDAKIPEPSSSEQLRTEIQRIGDASHFCEDLPAGINPNGRSGALNCDTGDGIFWAGVLSSVDAMWPADFVKGASQSIREDGKPYRGLSYLQAAREDKEFSRDQFLGLCHLAVTYPEFRPYLAKVRDYAKANGKLCEDRQCLFLTGNAFQAKIALGEGVSEPEIAADEVEVLAEATTTLAGSAQHLVSMDIWLRVRLGMNSEAYHHAADILVKRMPNNLWFQTLQRITDGQGPEEAYADVVTNILGCMKAWEKPGLHSTFSSDRTTSVCENRVEGAWGLDLVFLGKLLQQTEDFAALKFIQDDEP